MCGQLHIYCGLAVICCVNVFRDNRAKSNSNNSRITFPFLYRAQYDPWPLSDLIVCAGAYQVWISHKHPPRLNKLIRLCPLVDKGVCFILIQNRISVFVLCKQEARLRLASLPEVLHSLETDQTISWLQTKLSVSKFQLAT